MDPSIPSQSTGDIRARVAGKQAQRQQDGRISENAGPNSQGTQKDTFKAADTPDSPGPKVKIGYLPQDPGILPPEVAEFDKSQVKDGLQDDRVRIVEPRTFSLPHPDENGNYFYPTDNPRFDDAEEFVITNRALHMAEGYLGRELPWGFSQDLGRDQLLVHSHVGANTANAFYNSESGSTNFFSFTDPKTQEVLRTGMSADVVAHETGHAILDGIRHTYIGSLSVSGGGFHESFADMNSLLTALQDDSVIDRMHADTNGDLSKPNVVSNAAEMLGKAISHMMGGPETDALRTAINNYKYVDEHFLPYIDRKNPNQALGQEPHAYSNLFTATFYDVFTGLYNEAAADTSKSFKQAVVSARDTAGRLLFRGIEFGPAADPDYKDIALSMIKADQVDNAGKNRPLLEKVFKHREILTDDDLAAFDTEQAALPKVDLKPADMKDVESAGNFVTAHAQELGVPKDVDLQLLEAHSNKKGETFMVSVYNKMFDLDGPEFGALDGSRMAASGGLTMAFNPDGKLIYSHFQEITPQAIEDIRDHLKVAAANGALGIGQPDPNESVEQVPTLYVQESSGPNGSAFQRTPVIWG